MMKNISVLLIFIFISACSTVSGTYRIVSHDVNGKELGPKINLTDATSDMFGKYRRMLCKFNPKSVVTIKNTQTGHDMAGLSPYQCP
ncbi:hypothetical protein [Bartonella sp. HY038]|uniref:hypothetical protein n=1 Tax=Bartonella sp. HY038 TaxID=2759660 RepID=UPI0015FB5B6D|nr:hypothetical protein [Bartonella sp. HY038]